ncbi:hypothetical protein HYU40_01495 [Candidatus Woesearchaeota archaeon]|nr:hypothetical protein [Candidatus Woesearchaeota archaeon]
MKLRKIRKKGAATASGLAMFLVIATLGVLLFKSLGGNTNILDGMQLPKSLLGEIVVSVIGSYFVCILTKNNLSGNGRI